MSEIILVSLMAEIFFCFAISAMSFVRAMNTLEVPLAMSSLVFLLAGLIQYLFLEMYAIVGIVLSL